MTAKKGVLFAALAYAGWGLLPLYWTAFSSLSALEVLAYRIIWSAVFVWLLAFVLRRVQDVLGVGRHGKRLAAISVGAVLVTLNWLVYIYSVNSGHIVDASLGYYINPLVNVLLGVVFLRERLSRWQWVAIGVAALGVGSMVVVYGKVPWLALALAGTFGFYGLVKKLVPVDAFVSLTWETTLTFPISLLYVLWLTLAHQGHLHTLPPSHIVLLVLAGVATATPLLWFGMAARTLNLATIGVIQYLSPTITLLLGILIYHESFTRADLLSFSLIWAALVLYSGSMLQAARQRRNIPSATSGDPGEFAS
ncbi:EamA family transporter RarD [Alicyclobacillus cycloheptanicus]|uniref:Chloramphenicol-sensitive protein RarD n=1 Tax=Alicyclobacillus cycloheptanicus TaxID=1457 RepID=A0ABT9XLN0_9BACL|nr:EamA family transporter RarD [Alicyclobacillus cycloheptanicus]MDQ0191219.1 chloramphenicol-sensitive protein RarD [Alicyclobacillus cycloheptanicus]WDM01542.1 EamA family transporter RarD [Alicyclobacillus cycloheptanicus]